MERTPGLIAEYRFDGSLSDSSLSYNVTNLSAGVASYVVDDASINEVVNKHKYRLRINSTDKTIEEYKNSGELVSPGAGLGASIGGSLSSDSHTWRGDIAEVIIFDRVLTYEEIVELETYLKRKWGIIEGCRLPVDTTGYDVSGCNTIGEAEGLLVESACSVSCGAGYKADNFEEVTATCVTPGSEFMLHGCYLNDGSFKDDEPNFIRLKNASG